MVFEEGCSGNGEKGKWVWRFWFLRLSGDPEGKG